MSFGRILSANVSYYLIVWWYFVCTILIVLILVVVIIIIIVAMNVCDILRLSGVSARNDHDLLPSLTHLLCLS